MTKFSLNKNPSSTVSQPINRPASTGIYQGIIMENRDAQTMGRLSVWIPDFGGRRDDESNWYTVSYASPFAGATNVENLSDTGTDAQRSYGFWMVPPDIGNEVLICFVNGDTARGFFFACVYQQNMNQMVPGGAADKTGLPVIEYSRKDQAIDVNDPKRYKFDARVDGLTEQGLLNDPVRGPGTSSARREAPSRVFGYSTPRGNSIFADDGEIDTTKERDLKVDSDSDALDPKNEMIRLRTRSGMQIMLNETEGYIYMVSKNGKAWIQLGDDGIDFYSEKGFSIRTSGTQDIHTDGPLNIDATGDLNIIAGGKLNIYGVGNTSIGSDGDVIVEGKGKASIKAGSDILSTAGGNFLAEAAGTLGMKAGGQNMRSGTILDNSGSVPSAAAPSAVKPKRQTSPDVVNKAETSRDTATSRMPSAEPFKGHTNKGGPTTTVAEAEGNVTQPIASPPVKISKNTLENAAAVEACISQAVKDINAKYSDASFVTYGYMMSVAEIESARTFNPAIKPPAKFNSSAVGLYQFLDGTWDEVSKKAYGKVRPRSEKADPCISARVATQLAYMNGQYLIKNGFPATPTNLYMAHGSGNGGALKLLKAAKNPATTNESAALTVGTKISNANPALYKGKDGRTKTNAEFVAGLESLIGGRTAYWETTGKQKISAIQADARAKLSKPVGSA